MHKIANSHLSVSPHEEFIIHFIVFIETIETIAVSETYTNTVFSVLYNDLYYREKSTIAESIESFYL